MVIQKQVSTSRIKIGRFIVSAVGGKPYDEENLLIDRETLAAKIEHILSGEIDAPDALASLFVELRQGLEGGLCGINQTHDALALAVEVAYLHSRTHTSALKLYRLSQEGLLKPKDEPLELLDAAIARATAASGKGC
jgi:hypothetical protein